MCQQNVEHVRHVLPKIVTPKHYDLTLTPDLINFTFAGEVEVQYVIGSCDLTGINILNSQDKTGQLKLSIPTPLHTHATRARFVTSLIVQGYDLGADPGNPSQLQGAGALGGCRYPPGWHQVCDMPHGNVII